MTARFPALQMFLDAAFDAYDCLSTAPQARCSLQETRARLEPPTPSRDTPGSRLPVCAHLALALAAAEGMPALRELTAAFRAIEPALEWRRRSSHGGTASANFIDGHANATIVGPGGFEARDDV